MPVQQLLEAHYSCTANKATEQCVKPCANHLLEEEGKILRLNFSFNWKCFYLTNEQELWFSGEYFIFATVL